MSIQGIDHINIRTDRLPETIAFFEGLGLTQGWRPPFEFGGSWMYVGEQAVVHLVELPAAKLPSRDAALEHFAFSMVDYDEAIRRLEAMGVEHRTVAVPGAPIRSVFLHDPNGVLIELNCREPQPSI